MNTLIRSLILCGTLLLSLSCFTQASTQSIVSVDVRAAEFSQKQSLLLEGYDVVSYHQASGPVKGDKVHAFTYKGIHYQFKNAENLASFQESPEIYEPLYGGWCAYAMLNGDKTSVDPETYKIVDGKVLVFYNGLWGNTLEAWNKLELEGKTETKLIEQADAHWDQILGQ